MGGGGVKESVYVGRAESCMCVWGHLSVCGCVKSVEVWCAAAAVDGLCASVSRGQHVQCVCGGRSGDVMHPMATMMEICRHAA